MTSKQAWILAGVAAALVAVGYLATKREINASITVGEASVTYRSNGDAADGGSSGALTATEDSHARMMRLIEESSLAVKTYDVDVDNPQP